uniref:Putative Fe-S oxidoreductase n=1 Tax=bacterium enrichment culture clone fosmid MGS-K1 TaxID=1549356 RepID=A0A0B5KQR9_9BACT|nr:putative Fe-S oxidoreductase [bacterium enrichment culture clone fosmid MGS-K1]
MTTEETKMSTKFEVKWDLDRVSFGAQVESIIDQARASNSVLPLPLSMCKGMSMVEMVAAVQANIDCSGCNALMPNEVRRLSAAYPDIMKRASHESPDGVYRLYQPCPFLKDNWCMIYNQRPLVCRFYPFQFGALTADKRPMASVSPNCPEARRIARRFYMVAWELRQSFSGLSADEVNQALQEESGV